MNARFTLVTLVGALLAAGCTAGTTPPAPGRVPPQTAAPTATVATPLTPEQQQKIAALRATTRRRLAPVRPRLAAAETELRRLWSAEKPNRNAILAAQRRLLRLVQDNLAVEDEFHLGVRRVLSPAQRTGLLGDYFRGAGAGIGRLPGEPGAGIGSMLGGALGGSIASKQGGGGYGGFGGFLSGSLGSLFGGGGDEGEENEEDEEE